MQGPAFRFGAQQLNRPQPDFQMLRDAGLIEGVGHAGEFDFAVQRAVGNAQ
jgi:hypothetical protein